MSERDHGLLDAAGLSTADAAKLFNRSRQAIYTGLSNPRAYFSAENAMAILHEAKRTDSSRIEGLIKFIRANYSEGESNLILFDQVSQEQASRVVGEAEQVILVFNGNTEHFAATATFLKILKDLVVAERQFLFVVPGEWVVGYMEQNLSLKASSVIADDDITYMPSFVVTEKQGTYRAFFFLHHSTEEMTPTEAARLWKHFESNFSQSAPRKSRGSR